MNSKFFNNLLLGLILLTLLALYAHANWMTRSLRIDQIPNATITVVDDHSFGGKSVAKLVKSPKGITLQCTIADKYQWKFCELDIRLTEDNSGLDLSDFDSIKLDIESKGPEEVHAVRVFLRNFDPAYSKSKDAGDLKPHEVVYDPSKETAPVSFKLSQFTVASWWTQNHVSSIKNLGPQLERVTTFAITTGGEVASGDHEITLKSAELTGHWISEAKFRLIIIFFWIISMLVYLFIAWRLSRDDLRISVRLREQLREINESLELRVEQRTQELANTNQQLIESMRNLDGAAKLIQTEKMASLGQLVANVAHEINTPIGAIKSSGANIADALQQTLETLPRLFQVLSSAEQNLFIQLISHARTNTYLLNTREERTLTRDLNSTLEQLHIENSRNAASTLVRLRAHQASENYLPLLKHPEAEFILKTASSVAAIISSADNINRAVESVTKIIFALKSFSRVNTSEEMQEANLQDGLETVLTIYHNQIKQGTDVIRQFQAIPPLLCRPDELIQVWTNLIHNALQAMHYKGTLSVSIAHQDNTAVVKISDTGGGIADDILSKIFDPFFTTKPVGEGSGLGLDIAKKIIDKHHGHIEVQSSVGQGTTFSVVLPYTTP